MFIETKKHLQLFEDHKEDILSAWMQYDVVIQRLTKNTISVTFFKEKFASKVFDFAMSVIKGKNTKGNCPVIGVMLMLFKKKNIPLNDIFMICVHLKNALFQFAQTQDILNSALMKELSVLMDYNFEGVIVEYINMYSTDSSIKKNAAQKEQKKNKKAPLQEVQKKNVTSAKLYFQEVEIESEMIEELTELEIDTLDTIDAEVDLSQATLDESAKLFWQYAHVLNNMLEFEELSYTLTILSDMLHKADSDKLSDEIKSIVYSYLKAIISDLQSWRKAIFIEMNAEDIHYLDKTLMSSIAQLQMTLMPHDETKEDEIEFF